MSARLTAALADIKHSWRWWVLVLALALAANWFQPVDLVPSVLLQLSGVCLYQAMRRYRNV